MEFKRFDKLNEGESRKKMMSMPAIECPIWRAPNKAGKVGQGCLADHSLSLVADYILTCAVCISRLFRPYHLYHINKFLCCENLA